ncbi:MAG: hypothetical protein ACRD3M_12805 [Thermoanaerobaculia bacterium]
MRRVLLVGFLLPTVTEALAPQVPPRTEAPASPSPAAAVRPAPEKPPLDFTGVWVLDEKESRNVSPAMREAVLSVRQTGNQIWIDPMDPAGSHLLGESIVADGRTYEKTLGNKGKGLLTVAWAKDGKALWLEVTAGPGENPRQVVQRSVWKLSADRRVWVRQSVSIQDGKTQESMLVFRRRETRATTTPRR